MFANIFCQCVTLKQVFTRRPFACCFLQDVCANKMVAIFVSLVVCAWLKSKMKCRFEQTF